MFKHKALDQIGDVKIQRNDGMTMIDPTMKKVFLLPQQRSFLSESIPIIGVAIPSASCPPSRAMPVTD